MYPRHAKPAQPGDLMAVDMMRFVLERERVRAERTNNPFSLIVMRWENDTPPLQVIRQLAGIMSDRLRLTDDAGWLSGHELGVILTDTSEGGAWKVLRDIVDQLGDAWRPECEVYVYPSTPTLFDEDDEPLEDERPSSRSHDRHGSQGLRSGMRRNARTPNAARFFRRPLPLWKRAVDLILGSVMLLAATPILMLAAIAIKLSSPGPILFTQRRAGLGGRPFTIFKLRTMVTDAESQKAALRAISEQDGPAFKLRHDPRVTAVGRFLRKSCIDELPQLWNVIRGEMSIVGPRPLPVDEAAGCEIWEKRRLDVTPGLTCIWQVRGALKVSFAEWMRMDIRYIRNRRPLTDIKLIGQTAVAVLAHRASC